MKLASVAERIRLAWKVLRTPPVHIRMWGGPEARHVFASSSRSRGKVPLLRKRTFGMALMPLPQNLADPFPGPAFKSLRRRHRRAQQLGYTFAAFGGSSHLEQVLAIHNSAPERQGFPMAASYTDRGTVKRYLEASRSLYGVFNREGVLCAYCDWPVAGEGAMSVRIIGDHRLLQDGIMYFLVWEMALHFARQRANTGYPRWMTYASYLGGRREMRIFKKECGFRPYRVICQWLDEAPEQFVQAQAVAEGELDEALRLT